VQLNAAICTGFQNYKLQLQATHTAFGLLKIDRMLELKASGIMKTSQPLSLRRILVPIDFSKNARRALHFAIPLATQFGARITLLHVVESIVYPTEMAIMVTNERFALNASRKHLDELTRKLIPEKLRGKILVRGGQPYFEIAQIAREMKADLIVVTTHGYTGIKRVLLGGTAERIIRHAPCPVLTVRIH
jgi:nucleotide-binding universal stress UspA family protein